MRSVTRGKKPPIKAAKPTSAKRTKSISGASGVRRERQTFGQKLKMMTLGFTLLSSLAGAAYSWHTNLHEEAFVWAHTQVMQATARAGMAVETVYAIGRTETDRDDIVAALGLEVGDPILILNPEEARERLEALGWVKSAEVRRNLPNSVVVHLQEREAVAIWQHEQRFVLIDRDGVEIGEKDVHRHSHLKVVVGPDAPDHTMALLALLRSEPELEDRVIAAVRIGERRWNLRLEGGIDVSLPEKDAEIAWRKLADYQREHEILSRTVGQIDLRHPDRMTVQLTEPGMQEVMGRNQGEET